MTRTLALHKETVLSFCVLLGTVFFAYSNHFENSFHFDDSHTILNNPYIQDLQNLRLFFTDTRTFSSLPANRVYRPLVTASLALDYALAGGLNSAYFHASTFFWFLLQLVLMYTLFRKLCDLARPDPANRWAALIAASLYGVHPAIAETVNYVIQRGDLYSTLGVIAALVVYVSMPQWRKSGLYLVPVALALLSKPPALVFPLILFTYIWLFEERKLSRALTRCVPALLVTGMLGYLLVAMTPATFAPAPGSAYAYRMTQPLVALRYFRTFFIPNRLSADSDLAPVKSMLDQGAWTGFLFITMLIVVAGWCSQRPAWRPAAFGLWWFLLGLAPTSLFPLAEVENDHRLYFPFVGLVLAVTWCGALWIYGRRPMRWPLTVSLAALCAVTLAASIWATRQRNEVWRNDESLWLDVTLKSPRNGRGLMNYGLTQMEKGDFRKALDYFERAAVFTSAYSVLEINRGIADGALNRDGEADEHFVRAIKLAPNAAEGYFFYGRWLGQKYRRPEAIVYLQQAASANPDYMPARYLLMEMYAEQSDWVRLRGAAESVLLQFPSDATATRFLTRANSPDRESADFRVAGTPPRTAEDYVNLSLAYHRVGKFQECLAAARQALKLRPDYAEAFNNIAAAYEELEMWDLAIEAARQALRIRPDFQLARNNLQWAEEQKRKQSVK